MQSGERESHVVRSLTRIDPNAWPAERLEWLWHKLLTQDYAYDDLAEALGPKAFLTQLFQFNSEWYELEDDGLAVISGILPKCNAIVHFVVWGEVEMQELFPIQRWLFDDQFTRWQLNRITGYIPSFNRQAIRLATLTGMKYEGELRQAFLKHGTYHNLQIYGILRSEFYRRNEVKH